ncbi:MAG: hypothetical protein IJ702_03125 [Fretibacterium sp.]|nr:hypothetical protein [Fretibacterium sp.]
MNLFFPDISNLQYKSQSQRIRVVSELWMQNEMYCPACGKPHLVKTPNNAKVADFFCDACGEIYELKSKSGPLGNKILDGAYFSALERITSSTNPNLFVLHYCECDVIDLILIPKYFFTPDVLQRRNALSPNARRAGYIGSIILYDRIPVQGKISVIEAQSELDKAVVMNNYKKSERLRVNDLTTRGWLIDVLNCINRLQGEEFSIRDVYEFTSELEEKHPDNRNVQAKIRQQLQLLRDKHFIEFLGKGTYKKSR